MSLKGLRKTDSSISSVNESEIEEFIGGINKRTMFKKRPLKYLRQTFSLTQEVSEKIDELLLKSQVARANRSIIIKAAIQNLENLPEQELHNLVSKIIQEEKENNFY